MSKPRAQRAVAPTDIPQPRSPGNDNGRPEQGFAPTDPLVAFAYATLRRELEALTANRPDLDRVPTPAQIHQLRVAARRLRVGLRLFRRMLPSRDVTRFRADLRWFASALGDVRDLDVYAENFKAYSQALPPEQQSELGGYALYLRRERADARHKLTALFSEPRFSALFDDAETFLAAGPSAGALRRWRSLSVQDGIRDNVVKTAGRVRRAGNRVTSRSSATEIHEVRILAKRLRYELEFFTAVYPVLKETARAARAVQDLLGTHQDAYTANARLRRYAAILRTQGAGASVLPQALVELRRNQLRLARGVRTSFTEQWQGFLDVIANLRHTVAALSATR
jgi:CHAD domain-containing protein